MKPLALAALACLLPAAAAAQPAPGDLFATESAAGSIVNIADGGDFTGGPRFATGLTTPSAICLGPNGDLYAAESTGDLFVVTAGGDFAAALPFATGAGNVFSLLCTDSLLVADNFGGQILDATGGGDLSAATPFAEGLPLLVHLLRASDGTLYAQLGGGEIFDVTAGGDFSAATPFASGLGFAGGMAQSGTLLLTMDSPAGEVIDFTGGGDLAGDPPLASGLPSIAALFDVPGLGLFAASGNGSGVYEISTGGDFSGDPPFASGVATTFGLAGLAYIPGCGDAIEQAGESCDDGNTTPGDGCSATCEVEPLCAAAPATGCISATKAKLTIDERKPGKEKLAVSMSKLVLPVGEAELGNPVTGGTRYGVCLYTEAGTLVGELQVTRAGETCGNKPCWKLKGESTLVYSDPSAMDDGVVKLTGKGGSAGKGKLSLSARNKASKGQTALPALAAGFAGETSAIAQITTSDAGCFEASLTDVKKAEPTLFQAK